MQRNREDKDPSTLQKTFNFPLPEIGQRHSPYQKSLIANQIFSIQGERHQLLLRRDHFFTILSI